MESQDPNPHVFTDIPTPEDDERQGPRKQFPRLVFGIAAIGFLVFLAIGSVEARIWRFGRLYFEDRTVREVWGYLGDRLPSMPGQPVFTVLYWISVAVMVIGAVIGLWLFLGTEDEDPAADSVPVTSGSSISTHA